MSTDHVQEKPLSVLVVDDNPDDLLIFQRAVKAYGWRVSTADTGRTGFERSRTERYDVILLDYNLGDMTGTEVLLRIKELGLQTPVLIQSGLGSDFIVARALALGAEGFVAKDSPTYEGDLLAKVNAAVTRARTTGFSTARRGRRESVQEVETVLDDLLERSKGQIVAVGFATPDGFRVGTRFRATRRLSPETICAMVASATSTCNFLGEGLQLPALRLLTADFEEGRFYAAPVTGFGVLFAAVREGKEASPAFKSELEFAAKELATLLATTNPAEQYSY